MSILQISFLLATASGICYAAAPDHPLCFEQRDPKLFENRSDGSVVAIHPDRIALDGATLRFVHASKNARLEGQGTPAPSTYITRAQTRTFSQYPKLGIRQLYPGVDAVFYGTPGHLEYDLNLTSASSASRVRLAVDGAQGVYLGPRGDLIIETRSGEMRQLAPRVFQSRHGVRQEVPASYVLLSANEVGFRLGKHDRTMPLTIDPVIVYTKYFGGSGSDFGGPVATDAQGNVYVTGSTNSIDFPSTNGSKARLQPPLLAFSNAGQTVTPLRVGTAVSVTAMGGTADGKVLYVATPGGIYYSGDHGASFHQTAPLPVPVSLNSLYPPVFSVDAIDPSRVYLATSAGLFVGSGNGEGWGETVTGMAASGNGLVNVTSVQVSPLDHAIMYAATAPPNNLLYKTTNTGENWVQLNPMYPGEPAPGPFPSTNITFTLAPGGNDLYVIDGNAFLFKSTDGGATWQKLSAAYLFGAKSITIDPKNPSNIYVLDNFGVQLSTDGGTTFATISPSFPPGTYVQSFALDSSSGDLYIATYSQIEVSADQGATWKALPQRPNPHVLIALGGKVYAGVDSPRVPFVVKWSPDGSQMLYSTFFGGSFSDAITGIAVDAQGEAIIAGNTSSSDFPVTKTLLAAASGFGSGFVAKLSADGSRAIYSSLIGASKSVQINGVAIDASGSPYITGTTPASDFPTSANAPQPKLPTAMCQRGSTNIFLPSGDLGTYGFVSKLSADASSFVYSTFLTGACGSAGQDIAIDAAGEAVVVGYTTSPDFPVSSKAYQTTFPGGDAASTTYPNPTSFGFVSKLSAAGDKLTASSFIGGGFYTQANALALDSSGDAYITGSTWGITPGATPGAYQTQPATNCPPVFSIGPGPRSPSGGSDVFVLKLDPALSSAQFLTYLGGSCDDSGNSIVLGSSGNVWVGGSASQNFPLLTPFAAYGISGGFVSEFNADASQLLFSSYSDGSYLARDLNDAIYVSGTNGLNSANPPSALLIKIDPSGTPPVIINSIGPESAASSLPLLNSFIAPGELISIGGQHLGPSDTVMAKLDATGRLPFQVGATSVAFDGYIAPLISVQDNLIVCFAPFEITGSAEVTVTVDGQHSNSVRVGVQPSSGNILVIVNQDGTVNSADHPAPKGSVLTIYVTGLGLTSPLSQDGSVSAPPLPVPVVPVTVTIDGHSVQPQFAAAADGLVAGITQVNVQIPVTTYSLNPVNAYVNNGLAQIYIGQ